MNLPELRARNEQRRKLQDAATPGKWHRFNYIGQPGGLRRVKPLDRGNVEFPTGEDATFIAFSRNDCACEDVDALLVEIERLQHEISEMEAQAPDSDIYDER